VNANKIIRRTKGESLMKSLLNVTVAAAVLGALAASAHATAYTWDGGGTGNYWGDPLEWNLDSGFPNSNVDTATFSATAVVNLADSSGVDSSFTLKALSFTSASAGTFQLQNVSGGTGKLIFESDTGTATITTTRNGGKTNNWNVGIQLNSNLSVRASAGEGVRFNRAITSGVAGTGLTISGQVNGSGSSIAVSYMNAASSYTGATTIAGSSNTSNGNGGGKLQLGVDNALPVGTILTVAPSAVSGSTAQGGELKLAGFDQEVAGLSGVTHATAVGKITSTAEATFTINNADDYDFAGSIGGTTGSPISLVKKGIGTQTLSGVNNYTGDTTVEAGTLTLASTGELSFVIGASGVNNKITGDGAGQTVNLDGAFTFDLTGAGTTVGDSWTIVDYAGLAAVNVGATFAVTNAGWTETAGVWTGTDTNGATYAFSESTGVLAVIPEPATMCLLAVGGAACLFRRRK